MLITVEPATTLPITLALLKLKARIDTDDSDEDLLQSMRAAVAFVERQAGLILQPTTLQQRYDRWCDPIEIDAAPVRDVEEVSYLDVDGIEFVVDPGDYAWDRTPEGAVVTFERGFVKPSVASNRPGILRVTFTAGFNDPDESPQDPAYILPPQAQTVIVSLVKHFYDADGVIPQGAAERVDQAALWYIQQLRIFR